MHNHDELRSIVCELHSGTDETLAALTTQLANLQDGLKAGQSTAQLLTRIVALADQAFQQIHLSYLFSSPLWGPTARDSMGVASYVIRQESGLSGLVFV